MIELAARIRRTLVGRRRNLSTEITEAKLQNARRCGGLIFWIRPETGKGILMTETNNELSDDRLHVVFNPDGPDYQFVGDCLIDHQSASAGRIRVFKTDSGKYVLEQFRSAFRGRRPVCRSEVAKDFDKLAEVLVDTPGGKAVLTALGRPCVINL